MARPLDGVRVLDLSRVLSGPSCGKALADLGAEVIKVEPPEGDITRKAKPRIGGVAVYFAQQNCGKRCISVDLRTPDGLDLVLGIAGRSDVVLENFRPGVTDRLGLGYGQIRGPNPSVVYCSVTGYGQTGSAAGRRAYAPMMQAELGYLEWTARKHGIEPLADALSHADLYAGMQATVGILAALLHRQRTGEGQHVDVSMAETMLVANEWTAVELAGGDGGALTVFGGWNAPVLRLGDGTAVCCPGDPVSTFPQWARAMGHDELVSDQRFATHAARDANRKAMLDELQAWAETFERFEDFERALEPVQLAAGRIQTVPQAMSEGWAAERGALIDVGDERAGPVHLPRSPLRFSGSDAGTRGRPAYQGEHNREVLRDVLDLTDAEIDRLEAAGVLASRRVD